MRAILVASLFLFCACKKDDKKAAEPAGDKKPPEAQDAAPPADAPDIDAPPPIDAAVPDAAPVKFANAAEFEAKGTGLTNSILAVFKTAGKDCDKLAADLTKVLDDNLGLIEGIRAFEKENPKEAKAFDKKMKPRQKEFEATIGPAMEACQDHEGLQKAVQRLPD
jgi:hypothetical protein